MTIADSKQQSELEFVMIGELVPEDHLHREIDRHIDVSFMTWIPGTSLQGGRQQLSAYS